MLFFLFHRDSLKIAITGDTLDEIIKPDMKEEYMSMLYDHCGEKDYNPARGFYLLRRCCDRCQYVDKFEPGE